MQHQELIHINQDNAVKCNREFGWDLDLIDMALMESIKFFILSSNKEILSHEGIRYKKVDEMDVLNATPLMPIKSRSGILSRLRKLCKYGIFESHPGASNFIAIGDNSDIFQYAGDISVKDKYKFS